MSSVLSIAISGMQAAAARLQVSANNVANADSPAQDARYRQFRALLEADPEWHDGEIVLSG